MLFNDVPVRGAYFRGRDILNLVNTLTPGAHVSLEREPENPYDAFAVKVLYEGIHIGYVAREVAGWLSGHMEGETFSGIITSMQAGNRGNLEPWLSISAEPETLAHIEELATSGRYEVGVDPMDEPAPKARRPRHEVRLDSNSQAIAEDTAPVSDAVSDERDV